MDDKVELTQEQKDEKTRMFKERMANARAARSKKKAIVLSEDSTKDAPKTIKPAIVESDKVIWFGETDRNQHGKMSSDFPGWYFDKHIEDLSYDVEQLEKAIDMDTYRGQHLINARKELETKKGRLNKIIESKPRLEGKQKDRVAAVTKELGERIGAAMFSRDAVQKKFVDAHAEVDRITSPCIEVKSELEASYYKERGVTITNGKVPRLQAEICWKTMRKSLERDNIANTEILRAQRG